ncbi:MAG: PadR family transcriptional regulator [Gemmatimonadota bacterium]|jgi:DNA-binding PadR family transcriptional regulator
MPRGAHLGEFEQIVLLAVVRMEGEGYGAELRREIEEVTGRDVSVGSVYATLDRLEEKGLVASWEGDSTPVRGGRARRHFRITPAGARALIAQREMMGRLWRGVDLDRVEPA